MTISHKWGCLLNSKESALSFGFIVRQSIGVKLLAIIEIVLRPLKIENIILLYYR
jgi:hypothetical protein